MHMELDRLNREVDVKFTRQDAVEMQKVILNSNGSVRLLTVGGLNIVFMRQGAEICHDSLSLSAPIDVSGGGGYSS